MKNNIPVFRFGESAGAGRLLLVALAALLGPAAIAQTVPPAPPISILPFAVADAGDAGKDLARAACPAVSADTKNATPEEQAELLSAISAELKEKLSKKTPAEIAAAGAPLPEGGVVFTGCLTAIDGGNAKMRVVGAGMGASVIRAHVRIVRMVDGKPVLLQEFDEEAKGRNFGVGSGMLINAMRTKKTSLSGDGGSLADKIVKAYEKHEGTVAAK